ncbi:MAG: SDR family NAD(P)-dependent oxidoreductase [Frankiaceae bacterium]|nr:SDR family NAD(P)-dependent oxidoreductase [Frankiaceae bacterium]
MAPWTVDDIPDQTGRTALVTGANSGLGLHTSIALARRGARVLMACRNPDRAGEALARVSSEVPGGKAELVSLDLASLASIRTAAADVAGRAPTLDVLIDNAGVMAIPRAQTVDGFEMQLGTNHLGHFALTGLLLPQLLAAPDPRVVVVSSDAHKIGRMRFDDLMGEKSYGRWSAYGQSKLANLLFMRELDRRAAGRLIAVGAHPGYAATNLQSNYGNPVVDLFMKIGNRVIAQSDEAGAWPQLYAATMPDVKGGEYFGPSGMFGLRGAPHRDSPTRAAQNDETARRLWEISEQLTGVTYAY